MDIKPGRIFTVILLLIGGTTYGQDLKDVNGDLMVRIDTTTGILMDANNMQLGQFMPNGEVKDGAGRLIGKIEGNDFKDGNNDLMGHINPSDVTVFDVNNHLLGSIQQGTIVIDSNNDQIGEVSYSFNENWVAAYYFFFFTGAF